MATATATAAAFDAAAAALHKRFPGLPADTAAKARARWEIAGMTPAKAYDAGFNDRRNGAARRCYLDNDYDLGWRDAAPGGNGYRPDAPRCPDCGGEITRTWRDGDFDLYCPGQCD